MPKKTICIPQSKWPTHDPLHDMNNALPPSSSQSRSQALPPTSNNNNNNNNDGAIPSSTEDDDSDRVPANINPDGGDDGGDTTTTTPEQRARRLRILKTASFLDHLIRSFDLVVYCQISILYYMEYVHDILLISPPSPLPPLSPTTIHYMHER